MRYDTRAHRRVCHRGYMEFGVCSSLDNVITSFLSGASFGVNIYAAGYCLVFANVLFLGLYHYPLPFVVKRLACTRFRVGLHYIAVSREPPQG